jgi:cyclophilin family peptidyl-prolyl cis-trans isomerase
VANFLNYVNDGDYAGSFIHRSVPGFVVQGGGFTFINGEAGSVPSDPPIANEFGRSNVRGTVAMAKLGNDPDSATSQWFINLADNSAVLDDSNGGFTVFGVVEGNGMRVIDAITAQSRIENFGGAFAELPTLNYDGRSDLTDTNFAFTTISVAPEDAFEISPGIASSWYNPQTDGQGWFVDVIEDAPGVLRLFVAWFTYDDEAPPADEELDFGSEQHRWFTASGPVSGASATMDLFRNAGGQFNNPRATASERVGTLTMTFQSCGEATLEYDFEVGDGGSGEIDVVNLTPDSVCE